MPVARLALLLAAWIVLPPLRAAEVERIVREFRVDEHQVIRVEAPVVAVSLEPFPGREIRAELVISCAGDFYPCREQARRVALVSEPFEGKLQVKLVGPFNHLAGGEELRMIYQAGISSCRAGFRMGRIRVLGGPEKTNAPYRLSGDLTIRYPMGRALEVALERGHLLLTEPARSVSAEVGEGTVSIFLAAELAGNVALRASRGGRARLVLADGRLMDSGRRVTWAGGTGPVDLDIAVGKGDAAVRLTR